MNHKTAKIFLIPAILFTVFFAFGNEAKAATTYYVSPSGSDSNSGTISAPFKTIQKAANVVNPGDTVIVKDGIYTDTDGNSIIVSLTRGGTSSNWVTFKSEIKWGAKLDGQNYAANFGWNFLSTANYIRIENFEVYGTGHSGFWSNDEADYHYYSGNHVHHNGHIGFYQGGGTTHHTYDSNVIHDNGRITSDFNPNGLHDHGIYAYGRDNTIINNIFYNHNWGWDISLSGGCGSDGPNWLIANNIFDTYNTTGHAEGQIIIWTVNQAQCGSLTPQNPTNVTIQNNIFNNVLGDAGINISNVTYGAQTSYIFRNNIVYGGTRIARNTWYEAYPSDAWKKGWTESGNLTSTNPLFVDRNGRDYSLQGVSPAINAGYSVGNPIPTYDIVGKLRTLDGAYEIGVYEYAGSLVVDKTPPAVPTALTATSVSSTQVNLSWTASTDNVGVAGYKVYRNGSLLITQNSQLTTYNDTGLSPSTTYTYTISAYDAAGNNSDQSSPASATTNSASVVYLSDLSWISAINGWGPVEKDKSNGDTAAGDGKTITLNGTTYAKGLGVHAASDVQYNLAGAYSTFMADIGVDDESGTNGSVIFQVFADGAKLYDSGTMTGSTPTKQANVDITGKNTLQLVVADAGDGITSDHADWADARIIYADTTSPAAPTGFTVQ